MSELHPQNSQDQSSTIAIAGTFTAEPVEQPLRWWMHELGFADNIRFAPFNQIFQQLLDLASLIRTNRDGMNVLLVRLDDWSAVGDAPDVRGNLDHFLEAM